MHTCPTAACAPGPWRGPGGGGWMLGPPSRVDGAGVACRGGRAPRFRARLVYTHPAPIFLFFCLLSRLLGAAPPVPLHGRPAALQQDYADRSQQACCSRPDQWAHSLWCYVNLSRPGPQHWSGLWTFTRGHVYPPMRPPQVPQAPGSSQWHLPAQPPGWLLDPSPPPSCCSGGSSSRPASPGTRVAVSPGVGSILPADKW
jgi:hypothetical protein